MLEKQKLLQAVLIRVSSCAHMIAHMLYATRMHLIQAVLHSRNWFAICTDSQSYTLPCCSDVVVPLQFCDTSKLLYVCIHQLNDMAIECNVEMKVSCTKQS